MVAMAEPSGLIGFHVKVGPKAGPRSGSGRMICQTTLSLCSSSRRIWRMVRCRMSDLGVGVMRDTKTHVGYKGPQELSVPLKLLLHRRTKDQGGTPCRCSSRSLPPFEIHEDTHHRHVRQSSVKR